MRVNGLCFDATPRNTFFGHRSSTFFKVVISICLVFLLSYLCWLFFQILQSVQEVNSITQKIQNTQTSPNSVAKRKQISDLFSIKPAEGRILLTDIHSQVTRKALNGVIQQLNVPWHDIFEQLEASTSSEIALLSIEPDGQSGKIRLQAEAKSLDPLLRYASTLQQNGIFGRLSYSKHETNDQDPNRPVRLSFELELSAPKRFENSSTLGMPGAVQ